MSAAFLYISSGTADHAEMYLPYTAEAANQFELPDGARLYVWSTLSEVAGGAWHAIHHGGWMAWDGWIDSAPLHAPVGPWLATKLAESGLGAITTHAGEFSLINIQKSGEVRAFGDFLGARHLYFGETAGRIAISNRAMLASAALEQGKPVLEPLHLSWFMSSIACLFAGESVWRNVRTLGPREVLRIKDQQLRVEPAITPVQEVPTWDQHWEQLCSRVDGLVRRGSLPTRVAVTGGKDSRVVLAALVGSGAIQEIDTAYLRIPEGHPDLTVAQHLCRHYGIPFERLEPDDVSEDVETLLDRHNFQTEHGLHAWDLKGYKTRQREVGLHGNYGEIFRSHVNLRFVFGWKEIRRKYLDPRYLDLYEVMTPAAMDHVRGGIATWLDQQEDHGIRPLALHDQLHRAARMHRWVGQSSQIDGVGGLSANPIPSPILLQHYLGSSLIKQREHRIHFELTKRADDWLWKQPFAAASWPRSVVPLGSKRPRSVTATQPTSPRQVRLWNTQEHAISSLIMDTGCEEFHALFDRKKIAKMLEKTKNNPSAFHVRAVLGLAGMRRSLESPASVHRFKMEPCR